MSIRGPGETLTLSCDGEVCATLWVVRGRLAYTCTEDIGTLLERWASCGLAEWVDGEPRVTTAADPEFLGRVAQAVRRYPLWTAVLS